MLKRLLRFFTGTPELLAPIVPAAVSKRPLIVDDKTAVPIGADYRLRDDPPYLIRVRQAPPEGVHVRMFNDTPVAGVTKEGRQKHLESLIAGTERRLELVRAPMPDHPDAIKVIASWIDRSGRPHQEHIGYVPSANAATILDEHPDAQLAATLEAMFKAGNGKSAGLRMDVWRSPKTSRKKADS